MLYKINTLQSLRAVTDFKIDFNTHTKLPQRQSLSWLTEIRCITVMIRFSYIVVSVLLPMYVKCTIFLMIGFKCLGSSFSIAGEGGVVTAADCAMFAVDCAGHTAM